MNDFDKNYDNWTKDADKNDTYIYITPNVPVTNEYVHLYEVPKNCDDVPDFSAVECYSKPPALPAARTRNQLSKPSGNDGTNITTSSVHRVSGKENIFKNPFCKGRTFFFTLVALLTVVVVICVVLGIVCGTTDSCKGYDAPESFTTMEIPNTTQTTKPRKHSFSKCSGSPLMYEGKLCASTTRHDGMISGRGSCGCGPRNPDVPYNWSLTGYTALVNQAYFDTRGYTWCGEACGICFRLETTGGFVEGQGQPTTAGQKYVFMIVNMCNEDRWCGQLTNTDVNLYGYVAHFSLENNDAQIRRLDWDNPEVTFEKVDCDAAHNQNITTPNRDIFNNECECGNPS